MADCRTKLNTRQGVLICGAYGMGNAGDEAVLEAIIGQMRAIDPAMPITVLSRTPEETAKAHNVESVFTFDIPTFRRAAKRAALYINGGGSLIQDVTSRRSLVYYLYTLRAAKKLGCKVMMYGCGIGPVTRRGDIGLTRRVLNTSVDTITVREPHSEAELRRFGVTKPEIVIASDPALSLTAADDAAVDAILRSHGIAPDARYIVFCLRRWPGYQERARDFARAARHAYEEHGLTPLFLSINHQSDGEAADCAIEALGDVPHYIIREPLGSAGTIGVLSRAHAAVCMRLHGLIFAAVGGVPLAGVSYDPKVSAFLDYIGQKNYVELPRADGETLSCLVDAALEQGSGRGALYAEAARLCDLGNLNRRYAAQLLEVYDEETE